MFLRHFLSSLCLILNKLSLLSLLSFVKYIRFKLTLSPVIIVRICVFYLIITIKSEIWITSHCLVLGHKIMVCAVSQIEKFMGPIWVPPRSCRSQMSPMFAPWTLLSRITQPKSLYPPYGLRYDHTWKQKVCADKCVSMSSFMYPKSLSAISNFNVKIRFLKILASSISICW